MTKLNEFELQSKTIDWLRFPLAILVLFAHMHPAVDIQSVDYLNLNLRSWYDIIGTLVSRTVSDIAVPCFFMFSGYLFFCKIQEWNKAVYLAKVQTRLRTLVVPYILFNLVAIILAALPRILDGGIYHFLSQLLENWYRIFWNYSSWRVDEFNMFGLPMQPSFGPYVLPLWFLRDLIVMVFISPVVYYWVKYTKIWGLAVLFFFYYTKLWVEIPGYSGRLFINAIFFFSIGAFLGVSKKNMVISLRKYQLVWLAVALTTMVFSTYFRETFYDRFFLPAFILSGAISAVNIASYFMERGKLRVRETLARASFFIYCTHVILIFAYTKKLFGFIFGAMLGADSIVGILATYFTAPFACAGLILSVYILMKRFTPRFLSVFTGNR